MLKKLLISFASVITGITLLSCVASAKNICDPKDKITINDFYFEDFETGEKCYAVNSYPDEVGIYFEELLYWTDDTRFNPGEQRSDPFDKLYLSFTVNDSKSEYYGKTFTYSLGDSKCTINQRPMFEAANTLLYNIQYLFWYSYDTSSADFDKQLKVLDGIYNNMNFPEGEAEFSMTANLINCNEKSLKSTAVAYDGELTYNRKYDPCDIQKEYPESKDFYKRGEAVEIIMKEGDKLSLYPFISLSFNGEKTFEDNLSIKDLLAYSFINPDRVFNKNTVSYSDDNSGIIESYTKHAGQINENADNGTLVIEAKKTGTANIKVNVNLYIDHKEFAKANQNGQYDLFKAMFPTLVCADSSGANIYDSYVTLSSTFKVKVYPQSQNVDFEIDGVDISELDNVYTDCDFAVSAGDNLNITAEIEGKPYSYSFAKCDDIIMELSDGTDYYNAQIDNQKIYFNSTITKVIDMPFGTQTKKVKIIPKMFQIERFLNKYALDNSEILYIPVGTIESMAAYVTELMTETSGNNSYGIPMFPKEKSITLNYDSKYLNNPSFDRLEGKAETAETIVTANIGCGDDSFYPIEITVCVFSGDPELFVVPTNDVESLNALRRMSREEIREISLKKENENEIMSGASSSFYIFQYPNFTSKLNVEIKYGNALATVNQTGKNTYAIDTIKLGGNITLSVSGKDLEEELFLLKILNVTRIDFDKYQINYKMKKPSMNNMSFKGKDVTNKETLEEIMKSISGCVETNEYVIKFLADAKEYDGDIYFMYTGNVKLSSPNWELYSKGNGVHSDIYKYKPGVLVNGKRYNKGNFVLRIEESGATGTLYGFIAPPDGKQSVSNILNATNDLKATCEISGTFNENVETGAIGYDNLVSVFSNPFDGTIPITDDFGEIAAYYRCELLLDNDSITLNKGNKKSVRAIYKETAYVPYIVTKVGNNTLYCGNKSFSTSSIYAAQMICPGAQDWFIWTKDGDKAVFGSEICNIPGYGDIKTSDIFVSNGIRVWVEASIPATATVAKLTNGTIKASGNSLVFTDTNGETYPRNELCYAYIKGDTPENTITVDSFTNESDGLYIQGQQWQSTENGNIKKTKKIKYIGQTVCASVKQKVSITCPEEVVTPKTDSENPSVATVTNDIARYTQSFGGVADIIAPINAVNNVIKNKKTFNINITGVNGGTTKIVVYGKCSTRAELEVVVEATNTNDKTTTKEEVNNKKGVSKTATMPSGLSYTLSTYQNVYEFTGGTVYVPFVATSSGSSSVYGEIGNPYDGVTASIGIQGVEISVTDGLVVVTNVPKGTYNLTISAKPPFGGLIVSVTVIVN